MSNNATTSSGPRFDPVVKNGLFEVSYRQTVRRFRAVDSAQAKWKLIQRIKGGVVTPGMVGSKVIEPTLRRSGVKGGAL